MADVEIEIGSDLKGIVQGLENLKDQFATLKASVEGAGIKINDTFKQAAGIVNNTTDAIVKESTAITDLEKDIQSVREEMIRLADAKRKATGSDEIVKYDRKMQEAKLTIQEYTKELKNLQAANKVAGDGMITRFGQARMELMKLKAEMINAEKTGNKALFNDLAKRAGVLKDTIQDTNKLVSLMNPDAMLSNYIKLGRGIVGAFEAGAGAMLLFGDENEEMARIMQKTMGLMAILQGLEEMKAVFVEKELLKAIGLQIKQIFYKTVDVATTQAQVVATGEAAVAQEVLNTTMKANPIAFVVAGLAALTAGLAVLITWLNGATEAEEQMNKTMEDTVNNYSKEAAALSTLIGAYETSNKSVSDRKDLIDGINENYSKYLGYKVDDTFTEQELYVALQNTNREMEKKAILMAKEKILGELYAKLIKAQIALEKDRGGLVNGIIKDEISSLQEQIKAVQEMDIKFNKSGMEGGIISAEGVKLAAIYNEILKDRKKETEKIGKENSKSIERDKLEYQIVNSLVLSNIELINLLEKYNIAAENRTLVNGELIESEKAVDQWLQKENAKREFNLRYLKDELKETKANYIQRSKALKDALAADQISQEQYDQARIESFKQFQESADRINGYVAQAVQLANDIVNQSTENKLLKIEKSYNKEKDLLDKKLEKELISQAQYDEKLGKLNETRAAKERSIKEKAWKQSQALQIANATTTGFQAVLNAYASGMATPLVGPATATIYAAIAGAFAAAQIALIASQKMPEFEKGGFGILGGKRHIDGGISIPGVGNAEAGEGFAVFSRNAMNSNKNIPDIVDSINKGDKMALANTLMEMISFNPEKMANINNVIDRNINVNSNVSLSKVPELTEIRDLIAKQGSNQVYIDKHGNRHIISGNLKKIIH